MYRRKMDSDYPVLLILSKKCNVNTEFKSSDPKANDFVFSFQVIIRAEESLARDVVKHLQVTDCAFKTLSGYMEEYLSNRVFHIAKPSHS